MSLDKKARHLRRGWILHTLETSGGDTNDKLIQAVLADAGHDVVMPMLHADLAYLAEKGYLTLRLADELERSFVIKIARLTAKGQDLLDGSITDVGVAFSHKY